MGSAITVGSSVRVYPDTEQERLGVVVEDFGDSAGQPVQVGDRHVVGAARRWGVQLDDGDLIFLDDDDLSAV